MNLLKPDERNKLIDSFASAPQLLKEALQKLPEEMWQYKPSPKEWSVHEIIIHIPDAEASGFVRFRKLVSEPGSIMPIYEQNLYVDHLNYHSQSIDDALELFRLMRVMTTAVLRNIPESAWRNEAVHPELGPFTLNEWLPIYEEHIPKHIGQMNRNYEKWKAQK